MDAKQKPKTGEKNHANCKVRKVQKNTGNNPANKGQKRDVRNMRPVRSVAEKAHGREQPGGSILVCPFCQRPNSPDVYRTHMIPVTINNQVGRLWCMNCEFCDREVTDIDWQTITGNYQITIESGLTYIYAKGEQLCFQNNETTVEIVKTFRRWLELQEVF